MARRERGVVTAVIPQGSGVCEHRDYLFENIRFEEPAALLAVDWPEATLHNFRFMDISIAGKSGRNRLRANADGLSFENVRIGGITALRPADLNLTPEGETRNVLFLPAPSRAAPHLLSR